MSLRQNNTAPKPTLKRDRDIQPPVINMLATQTKTPMKKRKTELGSSKDLPKTPVKPTPPTPVMPDPILYADAAEDGLEFTLQKGSRDLTDSELAELRQNFGKDLAGALIGVHTAKPGTKNAGIESLYFNGDWQSHTHNGMRRAPGWVTKKQQEQRQANPGKSYSQHDTEIKTVFQVNEIHKRMEKFDLSYEILVNQQDQVEYLQKQMVHLQDQVDQLLARSVVRKFVPETPPLDDDIEDE